MPRGDKTGPKGAGPMTGRGAGYCAGYSIPGYANPIGTHERGWGTGRGRGWKHGFCRGRFVIPLPVAQTVSIPANQPIPQPQSPEQEIAALENYQKSLEAEKSDLEQEMGGIKARIEELKGKLEK